MEWSWACPTVDQECKEPGEIPDQVVVGREPSRLLFLFESPYWGGKNPRLIRGAHFFPPSSPAESSSICSALHEAGFEHRKIQMFPESLNRLRETGKPDVGALVL